MPCQIDFYVLRTASLDARKLAGRLAMMAWERGGRAQIRVSGAEQARAVDELLWDFPPGRFAPHGIVGTEAAEAAPIRITTEPAPGGGELVINLCSDPLAEPAGFDRLLEIVPHRKEDRDASREKYRHYRRLGLEPLTHHIDR